MNVKKYKSLLIFLTGVACGASVSYVFMKKKVEEEIEKGVAETREIYRSKLKTLKEIEQGLVNKQEEKIFSKGKPNVWIDLTDETKAELAKEKPPINQFLDIASYAKKIEDGTDLNDINTPGTYYYDKQSDPINYGDFYPKVKNESKTNDGLPKIPYLITEEDYNEDESHEKYSYTFYADGVFADELDNPVNIDKTIGQDINRYILAHLDDTKVDVVYVRNDILRNDYEILLSEQTYKELMGGDA